MLYTATLGPDATTNCYTYWEDPNDEAYVEVTPGYSLPAGFQLIYGEITPENPSWRSLTMKSVGVGPGTYVIHLDLIDSFARTTSVHTIRIN